MAIDAYVTVPNLSMYSMRPTLSKDWESHNFEKITNVHRFDVYEINVKSVWMIFPDFMDFWEYIDFIHF